MTSPKSIKWYRNDEVRRTTEQPSLSAIVQARRFSLFCHTVKMPDETDAKILIVSPCRTGGDHQDALVLRGWRLSSKTWNTITSHWMKQLTWLRIVHSGDCCLRLALHTPMLVRNDDVSMYTQNCQQWHAKQLGLLRTDGISTKTRGMWLSSNVFDWSTRVSVTDRQMDRW